MASDTKKSGSFHGKSNALGHGGRAAQLKAKGVPGGVIGAIARSKGAAPGGANFHGGPKGHNAGTAQVKKGPGLTTEVLKSMAASLK